ncbi:MAG: DUF4870 domain-containing protein, partial [Terriglobales bacterium]
MATDPIPNSLTQTDLAQTPLTPDERTVALLAHMLQIMLWWIAPLVIFVIRRNSKFVSFHALQALLLQIVHLLLPASAVILWLGVMLLAAASAPASGHRPPPPEIYLLMPVLLLSWIAVEVTILIAAIVYGLKAGRGEWAEYPVVGALALKILKLRPGGVPA